MSDKPVSIRHQYLLEKLKQNKLEEIECEIRDHLISNMVEATKKEEPINDELLKHYEKIKEKNLKEGLQFTAKVRIVEDLILKEIEKDKHDTYEGIDAE